MQVFCQGSPVLGYNSGNHIYPKYSNILSYLSANSVDPDQTALKEQFDLDLHCLPFSQYFVV